MKNTEQWKPSKFVYSKGKLKASRNVDEVNISSRLVADITAAFYDTYVKMHVAGNLLDLGCGKAPLYQAYKDYSTEIICVDWSDSLHKNQYLDFEMDLNKKLDFADDFFETVILSDVLEHIRNPDLLLTEIFRVLKPNGKLLMNVPFYYWLHEEPFDYFRFTRFALKAMSEEAGFKILLLKESGGVPEIFADFSSKLLIKVPLLGKLMAIGIQKSVQLFLKSGLGKNISEKTAKKFPLGYFMIAEKLG